MFLPTLATFISRETESHRRLRHITNIRHVGRIGSAVTFEMDRDVGAVGAGRTSLFNQPLLAPPLRPIPSTIPSTIGRALAVNVVSGLVLRPPGVGHHPSSLTEAAGPSLALNGDVGDQVRQRCGAVAVACTRPRGS